MFYALTNGQEDAPNGCDWACAAPFRIYSGACVPCNLTNPVDPALACMHPWLSVNGTGVRSSVQTGGVNYTLYVFPTSGYISFSQNTTVDVLVIGGGGAGGGAIPGQAGGGGGAGQVSIMYGVAATRGRNYTIKIGAGGAGVIGTYGVVGSSSAAFGVTAIAGGDGGPGTGNTGALGQIGASGGGSGSTGYPPFNRTS